MTTKFKKYAGTRKETIVESDMDLVAKFPGVFTAFEVPAEATEKVMAGDNNAEPEKKPEERRGPGRPTKQK